jgi:hypothetical protein
MITRRPDIAPAHATGRQGEGAADVELMSYVPRRSDRRSSAFAEAAASANDGVPAPSKIRNQKLSQRESPLWL